MKQVRHPNREAQMTDRAAADGEWVAIAHASRRLGLSVTAIWRLVDEGIIPSIRADEIERSPFRIPGDLVEEARQAARAGGKVALRQFALEWVARNAVAEAMTS
jgi:hypothetical protein